jgi:hypothetical protein
MRADDYPIQNPAAQDPGERLGHERGGFADRNQAQHAAVQARGDRGLLKRASDQMFGRRLFNRAARDCQNMRTKAGQGGNLSGRSSDRSSSTASSPH